MAGLSGAPVLKGTNTLFANLSAIAGLDKARASQAGAEVILTYMQSITPVDTGELMDSEHIVVENDSVSIQVDAEHASHVEFGTIKMRAQPFFRPAIDTQQKPAAKAIAADVTQQIKEIVLGR